MTRALPRLTGKLITLGIALVCVLTVCGCAPNGNNEPQTPESAYKAEVNAAAADLAAHLDSFNDAVTDGNIFTMRIEANNAMKSLDELSSIKAPDSCAEAQKDYVDGCTNLKAALTSYLDAYTAMQNATEDHPFDYAAYESQLPTIQDQYNAGMSSLQAGDEKAATVE